LSESGHQSSNFIACQSPTESARFWKMIWQQKVEVVVMLCPLEGPRGEESSAYWVSESINEGTELTWAVVEEV